MDMNDKIAIDSLLAELPGVEEVAQDLASAPAAPPRKQRDIPRMMRKIPVTLTLEVGEAKVLLQDLMAIGTDSVVELDTLAGEPLILKVNGTPIGRAEVVVTGDKYGLKVVEMSELDLDAL
ncbi:MAG TPA: FliM/FliN family flagellar motor switch protein [Ideonella sp.]|nr:FliM/FliN family flagellar motor switch protein [Ideonella sp.]